MITSFCFTRGAGRRLGSEERLDLLQLLPQQLTEQQEEGKQTSRLLWSRAWMCWDDLSTSSCSLQLHVYLHCAIKNWGLQDLTEEDVLLWNWCQVLRDSKTSPSCFSSVSSDGFSVARREKTLKLQFWTVGPGVRIITDEDGEAELEITGGGGKLHKVSGWRIVFTAFFNLPPVVFIRI